MAGQLSKAGIAQAALTLGCEPAAIRAVIAVESSGGGFLPDGRPKILFERHIFHRRTLGAFDDSHADLSDPARGGYAGGAGEYLRLYRALQLAPDAAAESASYGLFQIMGFNWQACGERSLLGFILAMHHSEDAHLALFVQFVSRKGLADELRTRNWAGFAHGYNGADYARHGYHIKLAQAYDRARNG